MSVTSKTQYPYTSYDYIADHLNGTAVSPSKIVPSTAITVYDNHYSLVDVPREHS